MIRRALPLLALLAASLAYGAVTTVDSRTVQLKRGSSIVGTFEGQSDCEKSKAERIAAEALTRFSGSATYSCIETRKTVASFSKNPPPPPTCPPLSAPTSRTQTCPAPTVGTWQQDLSYTSLYPTCSTAWLPETPPAGICAEPPPVPVDCAVSAWGAWTGGAWSACVNGTQSRQETRTRTVFVQPANGGAACPALTETRTASQSCTVDPPSGSITNLPVVCTATNVSEGATISACAWSSQRFAPATSSSLVRSCATASCTSSTATWRRLSNIGSRTVEVCTAPKLPNDPIVGGSCPTGSGGWSSMSFVPASSVARASEPPPPSSAIVFASGVSGTFAPLAGKTVSGSIAVKLSDCTPTGPIVFAVDGVDINSEFSCPWWLRGDDELYDTSSLINGQHRIEARTPSGTISATFTVANSTTPAPVNCAVSAWSAWTGGTWSACSGGTQTRQETRTRIIVTQPANGGTACPALSETRTASQSCTASTPGKASLSWTAPTKNTDGSALTNLAGYRIVYGTAADVLHQAVQIANPSATSYTVSGLAPGTYYFAVIAYTPTDQSSPSGIVSVVVK